MTEPLHVLYFTRNDELGSALEAHTEGNRLALSVSYVTDLERAISILEREPVDHVIVDSALAGRTEPDPVVVLQQNCPDVPVDTVSKLGIPTGGESGEREATDSEGVQALVGRIEDAVTAGPSGTSVEDEYFRALAEALSDAILVIDADSTIRFANPGVEDTFGYDPDELVGESLTTLMPEGFAERHREGLTRYLREGERNLDWRYAELPGRRRDGTEIPLGVSFGEFVSDGDLLFTGMVRDVSDQKRRERELRTRIEQRDALANFSQNALEDRPLPELMDEVSDLVADVLDNEYAGVLEYRPEREDLLVRAVTGWPEEMVDSDTIDADSGTQAGYTLRTEQPVVVEDFEIEGWLGGDNVLASADVASGVSVIIGSPDDPWGVLGTHSTDERSYTDYNVQFVQGAARLLTSAIQRKERERRRERYEAMVNAVEDGVYALDAEDRFLAVNDTYLDMTGYDREELVGEPVSKVVGEELHEAMDQIRAGLESNDEGVTVETTLPRADGDSIPIEARVSRFPLEGGESGRVGVVRDVSDRKRREAKLTSLHEMMRSLNDAETTTEIADLAVDAAVETLGFANAAIALYDDEAGALVSTVRRWSGGIIDDALLGDPTEDVAWQTFVEGGTRLYDDLEAELDADVQMSSALVVPLGKHGVFIAADPDREAFDETDSSLADILCSNVRSALARAEREEELREQRNALREKNRELERVERLNRVIREITKALTQAASEDEVMQAVCDRLTETGPYRFAWFGERDVATEEVTPRASAGVEKGYLDDVVVTTDRADAQGRGPAGRAVRTGEIQVQNDLLGDPPFEPWREQALKRGYRASAAIPVTYGGTLWGVLNLYADESGIFNEMEQEVLSELGDTIGYALNALEQREALVSERSVELDFRIRGSETPVMAFVTETGAEFEFENAVQRDDGKLHVFFTVRDVEPEVTLEYVEGISWITEARLVTERDGEYLYECSLGGESFLRTLVDRGAFPQSISVSEDESRFVVRIPQSGDVRTFVELFEQYYPSVELVARREYDEPVMTVQEFESELAGRLTERQQEVLRMAYFGGFFEWPRESTAEEIAEALGVSQPTVSRHIRGGERELFGLLFEGRDDRP